MAIQDDQNYKKLVPTYLTYPLIQSGQGLSSATFFLARVVTGLGIILIISLAINGYYILGLTILIISLIFRLKFFAYRFYNIDFVLSIGTALYCIYIQLWFAILIIFLIFIISITVFRIKVDNIKKQIYTSWIDSNKSS
jgi:hypothetical protein